MDLTTFRSRLGAYLRPAGHSRQELARVLGMHPSVLSHRLHGADGARLLRVEIAGIVHEEDAGRPARW